MIIRPKISYVRPIMSEEVLAQLEDRENSLVQVEAESNARLGTVYSRGLEENEMSVQQIEREVTALTSTGLMGTEMESRDSSSVSNNSHDILKYAIIVSLDSPRKKYFEFCLS